MVDDASLPSWDMTVRVINATIQLDQSHGDGTRTVGTGFLVQAPRPDGSTRTVLATAAHVLERMPAEEARVGWRYEGEGGTWRFAPEQLRIREAQTPLWVRHPDHDIAVMEIVAPEPFAGAALSLSSLADADALRRDGIGPGDEMIALGFPRGLSANRAGFPILRVGRVASYPLSPVTAFPTFLLDFTVFPGNSGGPVFISETVRRAPDATVDPAVILGVLIQQVELNAERLEIGVVAHAAYVREAIALLDETSPISTSAGR